eukprot:TRINITY_DN2659_c0_g1_i16.p3 TRINITY_DN2659_c0_g1~~TRINITY_DN2659_c0_g1_i16.p3  ORF type:complete len:306 (-),score=20.82 TRINITY_DN2659_c0_g1_i16:788-1705(-)
MRDLPYGYEILSENIIDPSHVLVAHHGMFGIDRNNAIGIDLDVLENATVEGGFIVSQYSKNLQKTIKRYFQPPVLHVLEDYLRGYSNLIIYTTPSMPGRCRIILKSQPRHEDTGRIKEAKFSLIPQWYIHLVQNTFFQQDSVFLYGQQQALAMDESIKQPYTKQYYMPTRSDTALGQFYKWFVTMAGGRVPFPDGVQYKPLTHNDLCNVYEQHTKNCKVCMGALNNFLKVRVLVWVACAFFTAFSIAHGVVGQSQQVILFNQSIILPNVKMLIFGMLGVLFVGVGLIVENLIQKFYFIDYKHYEH